MSSLIKTRVRINRDEFMQVNGREAAPPAYSGSVTVEFDSEQDGKLVLGIALTAVAIAQGWQPEDVCDAFGLPEDVAFAMVRADADGFSVEDAFFALERLGVTVVTYNKKHYGLPKRAGGAK